MSSLDNFFRKKLEERSFPQDDLAWKEMEDLLDDQNDRRPRLGWLFIFLGVSMLGLVTIINVPGWGISSEQPNYAQTKESVTAPNSATTEATLPATSTPINNQEANTESSIINPGSPTTNGLPTTNELSLTKNDDRFVTDKSTNQFKIDELKSNSGNISLPNSREELASTSSSQSLNENLKNGNDNSLEESIVSVETAEQGLLKNSTNLAEVIVPSTSILTEEIALTRLKAFDFLAHLSPSLSADETEEAKLPGSIKKQPRFKNLRLGLKAAYSYVLSNTPAQKFLVLAAGPNFQYPINRRWSLETGLHYKYVSSSAVDRQDATQNNRYNFGLTEYNTFSEAESLHYAGAELLISRSFGLLKLGAGLEIDRLLMVLGKGSQQTSLFPWEAGADGQVSYVTESQDGKLPLASENKWLLSPQLQMAYEFYRNTTLHFGVKYQLKDFYGLASDPNTPVVATQLWQLKLGVSYSFFNWKKKYDEK